MQLSVGPKLLRGQILALVYDAHMDKPGKPRPVTDREIWRVLDDVEFDTDRSIILGHLQYLAERGYVETEKAFHAAFGGEYVRVSLTGKGLQLCRGEFPPDPWVDPSAYEPVVASREST